MELFPVSSSRFIQVKENVLSLTLINLSKVWHIFISIHPKRLSLSSSYSQVHLLYTFGEVFFKRFVLAYEKVCTQ